MIYLTQGELGSGKTAVMTAVAKFRYFNQDKNVYANYNTKFDSDYIENIRDLKHIRPNSIVLLDELWLWTWSRKSGSSINEIIVQILTASRKKGYDIFYSQQVDTATDRMVRFITNEFVAPDVDGKIGYWANGQPKYQNLYGYFINGRTKKWYNLKYIGKLYDTNEVINPIVFDLQMVKEVIDKLRLDKVFMKLKLQVARRRHIQHNHGLARDDADYCIDIMKNYYNLIS